MNITAAILQADWTIFDNVQTVSVYAFNPNTETYAAPVSASALKVQTGEMAGLTRADTEAQDGAQLDGRLTNWLVKLATIKKYDKIVDSASKTYVVDVSTLKAMESYADCQCRDAE